MRRLLGALVAGVMALAGVVVTGGSTSPVAAATSTFFPVAPDRIFDSRAPGATVGAIGPGASFTINARSRPSVPDTATAVVLNVTAFQPSVATFLTVWPANLPRPNSSNLNPPAGVTVPNAVVVGLSPDGAFSIYNDQGNLDVIVDVTGYFVGGFQGVSPQRLMDTRENLGGVRFSAGGTQSLKVTDIAGVPASATAVALNVTATGATAPSFATVWPAGSNRPPSSNLNFGPGPAVPNLVVVAVGAGGQVNLYNDQGAVDLIVDVMGYFTPDSGFQGITPARLLDTREGTCGFSIGPKEVRVLRVIDRGGVPGAGVGAVVLNVTATRPTQAGYVALWPTGQTEPPTSNLNFVAAQTIPNTVIVGVGQAGQVSITNGAGNVDVIVDVMGYFGGTTPGGAIINCPGVTPPTTQPPTTQPPTTQPPTTQPPITGQTFAPGTYFVGSQIPTGRYRANGSRGCYWERLSGFGGSLAEIIANDFRGYAGPVIVDLKTGDVGFVFDADCGPFSTYQPPASAVGSFAAGSWVVGSDIQPGTYVANAGSGCYWERVSSFGGRLSDIIANDFRSGAGQAVVTISPTDVGFSTDDDCGIWTRIG